jgi:hypothetical protein
MEQMETLIADTHEIKAAAHSKLKRSSILRIFFHSISQWELKRRIYLRRHWLRTRRTKYKG